MPPPKLIANSISLLERMYDEKTQLFSFSTTLNDGKYINDFLDIGRFRYTVNVIAAFQKAQNYYKIPWDLDQLIETYVTKHLPHDLDVANRGLLLHILTLQKHAASKELYHWLVKKLGSKSRALKYPLQHLAWSSIGLTTYANKYRDEATINFARKVLNYLYQDLMNQTTLIPKYNQSSRGIFVSFGYIAYFLKAIHHFAATFNDSSIKAIFKEAVKRVLALQGENGEWPWFINSSTGKILDWYQIYSVHQDSMAMLFLLPAFDMGVEGAEEAICRSYRWLFGNNELNKYLILKEPLFIYRSIKRKESFEKEMRSLRTIKNSIFNKQAKRVPSQKLIIDKVCRSYHLGWILYVWSDRADFNEFTELELL